MVEPSETMFCSPRQIVKGQRAGGTARMPGPRSGKDGRSDGIAFERPIEVDFIAAAIPGLAEATLITGRRLYIGSDDIAAPS